MVDEEPNERKPKLNSPLSDAFDSIYDKLYMEGKIHPSSPTDAEKEAEKKALEEYYRQQREKTDSSDDTMQGALDRRHKADERVHTDIKSRGEPPIDILSNHYRFRDIPLDENKKLDSVHPGNESTGRMTASVNQETGDDSNPSYYGQHAVLDFGPSGEKRQLSMDSVDPHDAIHAGLGTPMPGRTDHTNRGIPFKGYFVRSANPMDMAWRLLKNVGEEEPLPYHGGSPPPAEDLWAPRKAQSEYQPTHIDHSQFQQWMDNSGLSLDDLSQWNAKHLDDAQAHAPSSEIHQVLSDERAKRGYNIIPEKNMIDVGRDPEKSPMPPNRNESDFYDSVHGDFNASLQDFNIKNAGEAMAISWRLLKEELTPEQEQKLEEMATSGAGFAVEEMRNTFLEQNRVAQQQQPQMTPEIQSNYQDPLDAIKQKKEEEMRIRVAMKGSRINNPRVKQMLQEFYKKYGQYPRHTPKSLRRR